jgi:GT2 family glycosyltransferase
MSISVISACKNRGKALSISISSWIQFDEVNEIIVVDWSSRNSISHLTKLSEKIKVVTVKNELYFNQPQPLNLAASLTKEKFILKLDSDTIINPYYNFFDYHNIDDNSFMTGITESNLNMFRNKKFKKRKKTPFFDPLWGTLFLTKENYHKVGGYNENMDEYAAWEDNEIVERLLLLGLKHKQIKFDLKTMFSIPHSSKERVENFRAYEKNTDLEVLIRKHLKEVHNTEDEKIVYKLLLEKHNRINWKKYKLTKDSSYYKESVIKWDITKINDQHYIAQKILNK